MAPEATSAITILFCDCSATMIHLLQAATVAGVSGLVTGGGVTTGFTLLFPEQAIASKLAPAIRYNNFFIISCSNFTQNRVKIPHCLQHRLRWLKRPVALIYFHFSKVAAAIAGDILPCGHIITIFSGN
jgi:hypothetical protein